MSDVLDTNLMLTGMLFLFSFFLAFLDKKTVRFIIFKFLSSTFHPHVFNFLSNLKQLTSMP